MTLMEAHSKLECTAISETKRVSKKLRYRYNDDYERCEARAIGKSQQNGFVKKSSHNITTKLLSLDISSVKNAEFPEVEVVTKPYWHVYC